MSESDRQECHRCGTENRAAYRYCSTCGVSLINGETERAAVESANTTSDQTSSGYRLADGDSAYQSPSATAYQSERAEENVADYEIASALSRLGAWLVDIVISIAVVAVAGQIFRVLGLSTNPVSDIILLIAYPVVVMFMVADRGQSPGKIALGIKIVRRDGSERKIGIGLAIMRELIGKFISGILLMLGFLWILFDDKRQGWHDKLGRVNTGAMPLL